MHCSLYLHMRLFIGTDTRWTAFYAFFCGLLLVPFSAAVTLALGYDCHWYLIPMFPYEMALALHQRIGEWGLFVVGSARLSLALFFILIGKRRVLVILAVAFIQCIGVLLALSQRFER